MTWKDLFKNENVFRCRVNNRETLANRNSISRIGSFLVALQLAPPSICCKWLFTFPVCSHFEAAEAHLWLHYNKQFKKNKKTKGRFCCALLLHLFLISFMRSMEFCNIFVFWCKKNPPNLFIPAVWSLIIILCGLKQDERLRASVPLDRVHNPRPAERPAEISKLWKHCKTLCRDASGLMSWTSRRLRLQLADATSTQCNMFRLAKVRGNISISD